MASAYIGGAFEVPRNLGREASQNLASQRGFGDGAKLIDVCEVIISMHEAL